MRPGNPAAGAVGKRGCISSDGKRSQQVRVQDQGCWPPPIGGSPVECPQGSHEEQVLLKCWFGFLYYQAVGGLQHHLAGRIRGIVIGQRFAEGVQ